MNPELDGVFADNLKAISARDWADFGIDNVAYLKPVVLQGAQRYAIHAANGTPLAVMDDRAVAYAAIVQNELEPVSLH